jgi:dUTP pyrophosphatase
MMQKVAKFHKISEDRFIADWRSATGCTMAEARAVYRRLRLPRRATIGSAGYDFFAPEAFSLVPYETIKIPTGIRAEIAEGWVLQIYPRSGLGFQYRLQLDNTVGIIDSDYFYADNEGHIFIKMTNTNRDGKTLNVAAGEGFAQGIFLPFGITEDDDADGERHGGFGSTTTK